MGKPSPPSPPAKPKGLDITTWAFAVVISLAFGFFGVQWQTAVNQAQANNQELVELEIEMDERFAGLDEKIDNEIKALEESNRTRRADVAALEARVAVLENQVKILAGGIIEP